METSVGGERPLPGVAAGSGGVTVVAAGTGDGAVAEAAMVVASEDATTVVAVDATVPDAAIESVDGTGVGDEAGTADVASGD